MLRERCFLSAAESPLVSAMAKPCLGDAMSVHSFWDLALVGQLFTACLLPFAISSLLTFRWCFDHRFLALRR